VLVNSGNQPTVLNRSPKSRQPLFSIVSAGNFYEIDGQAFILSFCTLVAVANGFLLSVRHDPAEHIEQLTT